MRKLLLLTISVIMMFTSYASAHSGRTDANGGHWNHSTGEYHYHNGGYTEPTYEYYDDTYECYDDTYESTEYYTEEYDDDYVYYEDNYVPYDLVVSGSMDYVNDMVRVITVERKLNPETNEWEISPKEIDLYDYISIKMWRADDDVDDGFKLDVIDNGIAVEQNDNYVELTGESGNLEIEVQPTNYYEEFKDQYQQVYNFSIPVEVDTYLTFDVTDEDIYQEPEEGQTDSSSTFNYKLLILPIGVGAIVIAAVVVIIIKKIM